MKGNDFMNINVTTKNYKVNTFEGKDFAKLKVFDEDRFLIYDFWISPETAEKVMNNCTEPLIFAGYTNKEYFTNPKAYVSKIKTVGGETLYEYKKA